MAVNKVVYGGNTLIDLTSDTVTPDKLAVGATAHDKTGAQITGTMSGGGGMNVQAYHGMSYARNTSYSSCTTPVQLTVEKTGTYKVSWMGYRNTTSGTSGSQLFINGTAHGSATTSFTSSYGQSVVLNNVQLTAGQTVEVRARARSTSYYMYVGNLIIEQIA